jgi:3-hydroxybutyryl-CoA dehydratase
LKKWKVGDAATVSQTITDANIDQFAALVGERNPVHLDDAFAGKLRLKDRLAHGMLAGSLISRAIGMEPSGTGAIYLGRILSSSLRCDREIR